jgi:predicted metal-dependent peptidase
MTDYPVPTSAERRAWRAKKENDRAVAAYRNSLPQGIRRLEALLASAESPWHAQIISSRIAGVRNQNRARNRRRDEARARLAK